VSLVAKVKDTAGSIYQQGKEKYEGSDAMQKAGQQAGEAAGQVAGRVKDIAAKTASKVKDARTKGAADK
jgi:hypothetical protein